MSIRNTMWRQLPGPIRRRISDRWARFGEWKVERPFWGAVLLMLAGAVIGWVPIQFATELAIIGGDFTVIGLVFASMVFLTGMLVMARPELSMTFGAIGIALSILSLIGALGGLFIGMLIGIFGGSLCIAWMGPEDDGTDDTTGGSGSEVGSVDEETKFSWQGDH